jgi:histidinol dehydrogenase
MVTRRLKSIEPGSGNSQTTGDVSSIVDGVIEDIRNNGDAAVRKYSEKFDSWSPKTFRLSEAEIDEIIASVDPRLINDIKQVQENVRVFAEAQKASLREFELEIQPGVFLGQKNNPIARVGWYAFVFQLESSMRTDATSYIPGGRYPLLASAHMTILTAKVAGVKQVVACTPPILGKMPAATIAAMHLAGADDILILGGVQAIGAMAVGTETISKVDFLAGPGNAFVAEAKRQLFGQVGIDLFAGPTEVLVVADEHADPYMCAVDLLSQCEHGPDTPGQLITNSEQVGRE